MTATSKSALGRATNFLVPNVTDAFTRFPAAVLVAVLLTAFYVFDIDEAVDARIEKNWRPLFALVASFFAALLVALSGEAARPENKTPWVPARMAAFAALVGAIVAVTVFWREAELFAPLAIAGLVALIAGVPFYFTSRNDDRYWFVNHEIWIGFLVAAVGALLFMIGLYMILWTLDYLFSISIDNDIYEKIAIIAFGLVAPINWLTLVPHPVESTVQTNERLFNNRAVSILVGYILVPILLAYTAILYAYAVKIGIEGELPRGRLGWMILTYGGIGMLTALMSYPDRDTGNGLVRLFWRHWFWLVLGPVALMVYALWFRVDAYGWTLERYLVALAALWLGGTSLLFAFTNWLRDLRLLPASLGVLLILASFGPQGAIGFSLRSQIGELRDILKGEGILQNGLLEAPGPQEKIKMESAENLKRIGSIMRYLDRHEALTRIRPWFANWDEDPFADTNRKRYSHTILAQFEGSERTGTAFTSLADPFRVKAYRLNGVGELLLPIHVYRQNDKGRGIDLTLPDGRLATLHLNGQVLRISFGDDPAVRTYDLFSALRRLNAAGEDQQDNQTSDDKKPKGLRLGSGIILSPTSGAPGIDIIISTIHGGYDSDGTGIVYNANIGLLLREEG